MGYDRKSFETIEFEDKLKQVMDTHKGLFNDLARQEFEEGFKAEVAELLRQIKIRDEEIARLKGEKND